MSRKLTINKSCPTRRKQYTTILRCRGQRREMCAASEALLSEAYCWPNQPYIIAVLCHITLHISKIKIEILLFTRLSDQYNNVLVCVYIVV